MMMNMMMPRTMPTMLLMPRDCPLTTFNVSTCGYDDEYDDAKAHANATAEAWRLSCNPLTTCGNDDEYDDAKAHANDTADA